MLEQLRAVLVNRGGRGIGGESAVGEFGGEIFARVEVFEEAADGLEVGVWEVDAVVLCARNCVSGTISILFVEIGKGQRNVQRPQQYSIQTTAIA